MYFPHTGWSETMKVGRGKRKLADLAIIRP
jgi:hypothetical protein